MGKKKKHQRHDWIPDWILEWREIFREIKNSHSFTHIFFDQERFMKFFDSRIWSILLSHNSQGERSNRYLTSKGLIIRDSRIKGIKSVVNRVHGVVKNVLKGGVLLVVAVCISRIHNRNIVERKNIYLRGLLPIPMNSIGSREESFCSSNIHRLVVSLLYPPKGKTFSGSCFMDGEEITWVLPRKKECIMRSSRWWRNQIGKKRDLTCNETVAGIEISFKENNSKHLGFLLLWHIDDPMVSWGKNQHESDFWLDNVWLGNKDRFVRKVRNILSNIQYDSTRSNFIQVKDSSQLKGSSDQSIDHFDSIRNEDTERTEIESDRFPKCLFGSSSKSRLSAEGEKQMNNHLLPEEIEEFLGNSTRSIHSFFSDRWSELYLGSNPTDRYLKEKIFCNRKQSFSFVPFRRRSEHKELVDLFKIIPYLQKTISIHPISPGGDMEKSNAEDRFAEMVNLFILSITEPNLVYHRRFSFSIDSYRLDQKKFLNEIFDRNVSNRFFLMNRSDRNFEYGIQKDSIGKDTLNHRTIIKSTINQHLSNWTKSQKKWFDPLICRTQRSRNWYPDAYSKWSNEFQNLQEDLLGYFSSKQEKLQVVFDQLRFYINEFLSYWYSIDWSEAYDIYDLNKSVRFFLPMARPFFYKSLAFFAKFLYLLYSRFSVHIGNIAIHSSEMYIYELKDPIHDKSLEPLGVQIVLLKKLKPFLLNDHNTSQRLNDHNTSQRLDDHNTSQGSKLLINEGRIFPFLFNEISKWMIDSFHTRKNRRKSFDNTDSYFSIIPHDRDNWLNPVKAFHRSSMISSFYKANRLRFLNDLHHFWFWVSCNKRFPFFVEKTRINNEDLTYRKFLNISFICNKIFSLYVGKKKHCFLTLSAIESQVSDIKIPQDQDFPQSGDKRDNLYNFMYKLYKKLYNKFYRSFIFPRTLYPIRSDPVVYRASSSIADLLRPIRSDPVVYRASSSIADLLRLEKSYWQSFSDMNRSDSKVKNLHQYLSVNSNMECESNPCSEKSLPSGKKEKWSLFRFRSKKKYVNKRRIQITIEKNLISVTLFEGNIEDNNFYLEWTINKECLLLIFTTNGFKPIRFILSEIFSYLILPTLVSKIHDIIDIPWVILEKILMKWKWTLISDKISSHWLVQLLRTITRLPRKKNESSPFSSFSLSIFSYRNESLISDELFFSIPFLLLVAGYLACRGLIFISRVSRELQIDLEKIKSLTNPSYIMELRKLLDRYPISSHPKKEYENRNLIDLLISFLTCLRSYLISFMPNNLIDGITFVINTRHLSRTSKEIYSLIRKRKKRDFMGNKIESWVANTDWIDDEEREFLVQLSTLRTEKRIDQILWSLTHSNLLYEIVEQPGSNYLRYLFDIQQKDLLNYEFNRSCLAERRIFLAYYETITSWGTFHLSSRPNPFSLRLAPYPSRSILVIGSIGIGRSYLVKSLAKNSYLPFIKIYPLKYPYLVDKSSFDTDQDFDIDRLEDFKDDDITYIPFDIDDFDVDDSGDIDDNLDFDKKLFNMTRDKLTSNDPFFFDMTVQFDLAKTMSPCIIWIPNIHDLDLDELRYLSLHLEESYLSNSKDRERCFTRNIIVIASTHIPREMDPALIGLNKFNTFIKIRRLTIPEQRKYFLILSYTRGFGLEKKIFDSKKFGSITMSSNARHLVALNNEVLSISITQRKYIIEETYPIKLAFYRQTWDFQTYIRWFQDHRIFLYQIGRAFAQNVFLSNFPIDPISIYLKDPIAKNRIWNSYSYKWYVELETNLKKITILLYLLSCSAGLVTQDLWSSPGPDAKNWITSSEFVEDDSHLVQSLLELEDFLVGSLWIEKNCSETLLLRSEPRNPLDMMQHRSFSIRYRRLRYEIDESEFEEGHEAVNPQQIENDFFNQNQIVRSPKIWRYIFDNLEIENIKKLMKLGLPYWAKSFQGEWPFYHEEDKLQEDKLQEDKLQEDKLQEDKLQEDKLQEEELQEDKLQEEELQEEELQEEELQEEELQENDSEFLQSRTIQYQKRERFSKEQSFFLISRFIWEPPQPFFLVVIWLDFWLSRRELVPDENPDEKRPDLNKHLSSNIYDNWFNKQKKHLELLTRRQRWQRRLRINSSLSKGSFPSHILFESYQYLANLFLSNGRLLDQMTKTLLRKRWLFPEEMNHLIRGTGKRFPIPYP
uniref:Ycf2 protein n=2 Tax=Cyperaceae TaxID=4609 RepID=A0A288PEV1_9POAL|nr:ycf2 protein [Hypolytrum nemorum]YP_009433868.1 ycf2 protein [Hypolytrum nemorum]QIB72598.1 ycf2 protein [Cyperus glomeratus]QIB72691.1 ycf2 protein [Cyperus difformis]QIT06783.1 Ycf2 protein [Cyperus fuscus]ANP26059.1 ycf2 protein [Hypolytrum nemorum]ANP26082.1 ycf2 protein [Hypolytrum nemorum]